MIFPTLDKRVVCVFMLCIGAVAATNVFSEKEATVPDSGSSLIPGGIFRDAQLDSVTYKQSTTEEQRTAPLQLVPESTEDCSSTPKKPYCLENGCVWQKKNGVGICSACSINTSSKRCLKVSCAWKGKRNNGVCSSCRTVSTKNKCAAAKCAWKKKTCLSCVELTKRKECRKFNCEWNQKRSVCAAASKDVASLSPSLAPSSSPSLAPSSQMNSVLMTIFNSFGGEDWHSNENWGESSDHCNWMGLTCHNDVISGIHLDANNLSGTIPTEIGMMTDLTNLYICKGLFFMLYGAKVHCSCCTSTDMYLTPIALVSKSTFFTSATNS